MKTKASVRNWPRGSSSSQGSSPTVREEDRNPTVREGAKNCILAHARVSANCTLLRNTAPSLQGKTAPSLQGELHPRSRSGFSLLDLYSRRSSDIVLTLAVKKRRQVIELNRPDVQMFSRMHVQTTAERHRKCGVTLDAWRQQIFESRTHMRDAKLRVRKGNDTR